MKILKDVTEGIEPFPLLPYQQALRDRLNQGGFKPGQLSIFAAGRQVGKSALTMQAIDRLVRDLNSRPIEELVLGDRRIHGSRFYTVEPVGGNWLEMDHWARETYGEPSTLWVSPDDLVQCRWFANDRKFWFRKERDRTMFILKWSV
jgi:hypothetical protein